MAVVKFCDICGRRNAYRAYMHLRDSKGKALKHCTLGDFCEECFEKIRKVVEEMKNVGDEGEEPHQGGAG